MQMPTDFGPAETWKRAADSAIIGSYAGELAAVIGQALENRDDDAALTGRPHRTVPEPSALRRVRREPQRQALLQ
jgi:hypothetical protein